MPGQNADILRQTQLGIQNSLGTAVGANVLLNSIAIEPKANIAKQMLYSKGEKAAIGQVRTKGSHTTAKMSGFAGFNDLAYIISILKKAATITTPSGATLARDWTWLFLTRGAETPKYASVETGIAGTDLQRFADGYLNSLQLSFEKNAECKIDGDMFGTLLADEGVTATSSPTEIVSVPLSVDLMDMYVADTIGGLSSGLMASLYKATLSLGDLRNMVFPIRSDKPSFAGTVETRNKAMTHIEIEHDTQSYYMMRQAYQTSTRYGKIFIQGPAIESGFNYEFEVTQAFDVASEDRGPQDEVYQGMYDLESVHDPTLGGFLKIRLRCKLASLISSTDLLSGQQPATLISSQSAVGFASL